MGRKEKEGKGRKKKKRYVTVPVFLMRVLKKQ